MSGEERTSRNRTCATLQAVLPPAQDTPLRDFSRSVDVASQPLHTYAQVSSALPMQGNFPTARMSQDEHRMLPDDPHYFDSSDDANFENSYQSYDSSEIPEGDPDEINQKFKERFDVDALTGRKEPNIPADSSSESQRTRRMVTSLKDIDSMAQLLQENSIKRKEYLRRTAWFKQISKPVEVFRPEDVKMDLEKDFEYSADPLRFPEVLLRRIKSIQIELRTVLSIECPEKSDLLLNPLVLDKVLNQLVKGEVHICVIGCINSGKSTLINALLDEALLPVAQDTETALNTCIQHSDVEEPVLTHKGQKIQGRKSIEEYLKKQHKGIRNKTVMLEERCTLELHAPLLQQDVRHRNVKAVLVDTPGSNEVGQKELQRLAQANVDSAAAYIYLMRYDNAKAETDYNVFKMIHERDKDIFQSERLTIVLTRMDAYYTEGNSQDSNPEAMKKKVADTVTKTIGTRVAPELVYPVSGRWAMSVQEYKKFNGEKERRVIERAWEDMHESRGFGQDESVGHSTQRIDYTKIFKEVLEESGIDKLRKRISEIIVQLVKLQNLNALVSSEAFLKSTMECLEVLKTKAAEEVETAETNMTSSANIATSQEEMVESITDKSLILKNLQEKYYALDTAYTGKVESKVQKLLAVEKKVFQQHIGQKNYTEEEMKTDIQRMCERGENWMTELIQHTHFSRCHMLVEWEIYSISRKFGRVQSDLITISGDKQGPWTARHELQKRFEEGTSIEEILDFDESVENSGIKLQELIPSTDITMLSVTHHKIQWSWILWKIRRIKHSEQLVCLEDKDVEKIFEDMKQSLQKMHEECFEKIKDEIVKRFFYHYCTTVDENLDCLNVIATKELLKVKKRFEELHDEYKHKKFILTKLEKWLKHLGELKVDLQRVSFDLKYRC